LSSLTLLKLNIAPADLVKKDEGSDLASFTCNVAEVEYTLVEYLRKTKEDKIKKIIEAKNHGQKKA
jgi:hypothetical protein